MRDSLAATYFTNVKLSIRECRPKRLLVLSNDFDQSNDILVEFLQVFGGNPPLGVMVAAHFVDNITVHEAFLHREPCHITDAALRHIPLDRNLAGIFFVGHGIKDRLLGQARRPATESAGGDQF